jgi:hypothetical protein
MSTFLATHRDDIVDALRVRAIAVGLGISGTRENYGGSVATVDTATQRSLPPDADLLLAPDPAWGVEHIEPPDSLILDRVNAWLATHLAPSLGTRSGLEPASVLRAANGRLLAGLLPRAALVIGAWIDRHGVVAAPAWMDNPDGLIRDLALSGQLDFERLDVDAVMEVVAARQGWPPEMERTIDLSRLRLSEADLLDRKGKDARRQAIEERAKRGVEVAGRIVTLDPDTVADAVDHIVATVTAASLNVPAHDVNLAAAPVPGRKGGGGGGGGGGGRPPQEKLETIGLVGEVVAWTWLQHHFGESNVIWRSRNRANAIHDGDPGSDSLGFDFEILRGRSRLYYEVKASTSDPREFELTEAEVRFALSKAHTNTYRVLYIGNVDDPETRVILPLPNPLAARSRDRYRVSGSGVKYAFASAGQ